MEIWKPVDWLDRYKGILEVSSAARFRRSGYRFHCMRGEKAFSSSKPDKVLSPQLERNGYMSVAIQIDGRRKRLAVHRVVGRAFVPGYEPGLTINHINGVKNDNRPENLEWVTLALNTKKQWEDGLVNLRGNANPNRKLHSGQVRVIRKLLKMGATGGEIALLAGVSSSTIYLIEKGERWASVS